MTAPTKLLSKWTLSISKYFDMEKDTSTNRGGNSEALSSSLLKKPDDGIDDFENAKPDIQVSQPRQQGNQETKESETEMSLQDKMTEAKALYPGSKDWHVDEERLFEILYLRQDLPMLPSHWTVDFRGFPIPENIFGTSEEHPPIVYAHTKDGSKEYSATTAITRLVDLTLSVRTVLESEKPDKFIQQKILRRRAAQLIKDSLDDVLTWAARDGSYSHHRVVPNIIAEVVDAPETQEDIVEFMMSKMRTLSQLQRDFYRADRDANFWDSNDLMVLGSGSKPHSSLKRKRGLWAGLKRAFDASPSTPNLTWDELADESPNSLSSPETLRTPLAKKSRLSTSPAIKADALAHDDEDRPIPSIEADLADKKPSKAYETPVVKAEPEERPLVQVARPRTPTSFSREPPVVYGLFVLGTTVFLLTLDSSKGDAGYISFHVDINFADNHQSVWNALTVAVAVCSARDELMSRLDDFKEVIPGDESDPDQ